MGTGEEGGCFVYGLMTMRGDDFLPGLILVEGVIMVMVVITWVLSLV